MHYAQREGTRTRRTWINELGYYVRNELTREERKWFHANRYREVGGCASATVDATARDSLTWWEQWNRRTALLRMGKPTARALYHAL